MWYISIIWASPIFVNMELPILYNYCGGYVIYSRIRDLREDNDLKQIQLAKYLSVDQSTYSDYENGRINVPVEMLIKLADYYDVSIDYIVGRTDNPNISK